MSNSPRSERTACQEGMSSESPEPLAARSRTAKASRIWDRGVMTSKAVRNRVHGPTQCGTTVVTTRCTKGERKPVVVGARRAQA
jgi:hypothetical protein